MRILVLLWTALLLMACAKDDGGQPEEPKPAASNSVLKYLALGDSYTIGTAIGVDSSYSAQLRDSLLSGDSTIDSIYYEVIATNGWTTRDLINGISGREPASDFDVVTMLIGVNNQYQGRSVSQYKSEFTQLLKQAIGFAGGDTNKVLIVSIPDWSVSPAGAGNRAAVGLKIDEFNAAQKSVCDSLQVTYVDITEISRTGLNRSDLIASDGLHFSTKMQSLWMRELYPYWYAKLKAE